MPELRIQLPAFGWYPRPHQLGLWRAMQGGKKRAIEIAHRRWGKDEICLHWAARAAHQRIGGYWHCLPSFSQAKKAIWTAVNPHTGRRRIDEAFPRELRASTNEQEMFIRFKNGSTWQVIGSDRYDNLVGGSVAGITFSEWALANPGAWGYFSPILVENDGWAVFITTSRGRNHAKTMLDMAQLNPDDWFSEISRASDTGVISAAAIENQRKEYHSIFGADQGDALIEQEFFCSFQAAVLGSYYGREMTAMENEGRLCNLEINPDLPVYSAWDLGISDSMAIVCFQLEPGRVNVVDYYEASGYDFKHYADWLAQRGYFGADYVPHDARVRVLGGQQEIPRTRVEALGSHGRKPELVIDHKLPDGIQATRRMLGRAWIDPRRCSRLIECLREYRREWDDDLKIFKDRPLHDWASHGADSARTMAMSPLMAKEPEPVAPPPKYLQDATLDDLWDVQARRSGGRI